MERQASIEIVASGGRYQVTHRYPTQSGATATRTILEDTTPGVMQRLWEILNRNPGLHMVIRGKVE